MPRDGSQTRQKILDAAHQLLLENGLTGASIERIVESAGITKGAFFYHFDDKDALLLALVERFAEADRQHYYDAIQRVDRMASTDPLERLLLFVGIFIDQFSSLESPPGCLYASYLYQQGVIAPGALAIIGEAIHFWREKIAVLIEASIEKYPPRQSINSESLADLFTTTIEGAFIMAKTLQEPLFIAEQLKHYQHYLEYIFRGPR